MLHDGLLGPAEGLVAKYIVKNLQVRHLKRYQIRSCSRIFRGRQVAKGHTFPLA